MIAAEVRRFSVTAPRGAFTPVNVTGKYNDAGTFKILNKSIPVSFSAACPVSTSTASMSATYTPSPGIFDVG